MTTGNSGQTSFISETQAFINAGEAIPAISLIAILWAPKSRNDLAKSLAHLTLYRVGSG